MTYVSGSSVSGAVTTHNASLPSGAQTGDVVLSFHGNDFGTYAGMSANAAFTFLNGFDGGASGVHFRCYYRVIDGSESGTYSFTNSTTSESTVLMVMHRGVTITGLTSTFTSEATGDANWNCPSLSPGTGNGDLICYVGFGPDNVSNSFTPPSGMTERHDLASSVWFSSTVATLDSPGTPTGTRTFVSTQTVSWATAAAVTSIYLPSSGPPPPAAEESFYSSAMDAMTAYM